MRLRDLAEIADPEQNRVLPLFEAFRIHTLDRYDYAWQRADGRKVSDKTIREVIGESIPPAGLQAIIDHLIGILQSEKSPLDELGPLAMAFFLPTRTKTAIPTCC